MQFIPYFEPFIPQITIVYYLCYTSVEVIKMKKQQNKELPKYNMWQNTGFMIGLSWKYYKPTWILCLVGAVSAVGINIAELFLAPVILQKVEYDAPLKELLLTILVFIGVLLLLKSINTYTDTNTVGRNFLRVHIMKLLDEKYAVTSYPNMENPTILQQFENAITETATNHASTQQIWSTLGNLITNIVGLILYFYLLSSINLALIGITLATTLSGYAINLKINAWDYKYRQEEGKYHKQLDYIFMKTEDISLGKELRIFGMHQWFTEILDKTKHLYQAFLLKREKAFLLANLADVILTILRNGLAYYYLITITLQESLPASQFLLYFTAINGFATWFTGILKEFTTLHQHSLKISCIREFLDLPEPFLFEKGESITPDTNASYELQLRNVSFRYPDASSDTIHHLNLTIHPGEKLAIVGLNGAGKTTLVKLLCGLYGPTEGQILLNGKDIRLFNRCEYYTLFSTVFQESSIIETTLEENIAQHTISIDRDKMEQCIEKSGLTETIRKLPNGYQTHIGKIIYSDGIQLSGGQMQRLMLARALYKDGPILILDEPTAALDPIAENDMYLKYNEMTQGRTSIFISHRLASTRFCDRIIFLENGTILEEGTHDTLMNLHGKYADLFEVQSQYYKEGGDLYVI